MLLFLFTDIEGSTRLWERYPDLMGKAITRHDAILRSCIEEFGGQVFKQAGDGVLAVFNEGEPLRCSIEILRRIGEEDWQDLGELRVRVALHIGEAEKHGDDYLGPALNRTAKLLDIGWGGQIVLTQAIVDAFDLPPEARFENLGVHTLKNLSEPQQIYALVHPKLPLKKFPPLRTLDTRPNNLPIQSTSFVGRKSELAEIAKFLQTPSCRLLTLLGPGGVGKTRIALQVAADMIEDYPHGVYFVALASTESPELLTQAVALALSFNFYTKQNPQTQLLNYLRKKRLLLLMDNFEHLTEGASWVSDVLEQAPGVKVLATSRERLNLQGEWVFEVRGMRFPGAKGIGDLESYSGLELFKQSAVRVRRDFELNEETAPLVAEVCKLVNGLPLALELAASWLRILSLEEIIEEIEKSFDFLETSTRDMPERHKSLSAVFEYSWRLLTDKEKDILQKLAVFQGSFTKDAAEDVSGASLPTLSALLDKSLLRKTMENRYDLHEVIRQYAEMKLAVYPTEHEKTKKRHCRYYGGFLESRVDELQGPRQIEIGKEVGREFDNLRKGWYNAIEDGEAETVKKYLSGMSFLYQNEGLLQEAEETLSRAVENLSEKGGLIHACVLRKQAIFSYNTGHYEKARKLLERSLVIFREKQNREGEALALTNLGNVALFEGNFKEAEDHFSKCLATYEETGAILERLDVLNSMGIVKREKGDYLKARELFTEALSRAEELGNPSAISKTLVNLGNTVANLGEYEEAKKLYKRSLDIYDKLGERWVKAMILHNLGELAYIQDQKEKARPYLIESLAMFRELCDMWAMSRPINLLTDIALEEGKFEEGQYEEAEQYFTERLTVSEEINDRRGMAEALEGLSTLARSKHNYDKAEEMTRKSRTIYKDLGDQQRELNSLLKLGKLTLEKGEVEKAREYLISVLEGALLIDYESIMLLTLMDMAQVYSEGGDRFTGLGLARFVRGHTNATVHLKNRAKVFIDVLGPTKAEIKKADSLVGKKLKEIVEGVLAGE